MISVVAKVITDYLYANKIIAANDKDVYDYGFEILLSTLLEIIISVTVGLLMRSMLDTVVFVIIFVVLRSFSGGYHAQSYFKCNVIYTVNLLAVLVFSHYCSEMFSLEVCCILWSLSVAVFSVYAPIENPNKPLNETQKKMFRRRLLTCDAVAIMINVFLCLEGNRLSGVIALTILSVSLSVITEVYIKRRDKDEGS